MADSFLPPVIVELTAEDTGAVKAIQALVRALKAVPETAQAAADAMRVVQEAATAMGEGIVEPLDAAKTALRGVASAMRALGKTAATTDDEGRTAMQQIAEQAQSMGTSVTEAATASRESLAGLGAQFRTVAGESATAAAETAAAARDSVVASEESATAATRSAETSTAAMGETAGALMKYATGLGATAFGVVEAVKGASKFNTEITKLNTQAGVSKGQLASLSQGVLNLAGQVGQNPDSLAEALFHVESSFASTGITGAKAMEILRVGAEGAKVGGANLVDVQNALDAAVASGIPGVQNFSQAMGALNAIVGSGDMQMQDLANALGTGVLAVVKGYGLSLRDVGSALATFGDNNIRGAVAATDLRMAVQALAVPAKSADTDLKRFGMTQDTLKDDMQKGGLGLALNDLAQRMQKAGVKSTEVGGIITDMFGKKAGSGLAVLMGQLDRFNSKYPELDKSAKGFGDAWANTKQTIATQFDEMKASLESLGIKIGSALLPPLSKFLGWVRQGIGWITAHKAAVQGLTAVVAGTLIGALWGVVSALVAMDSVPIVAVIAGIAAALIFAYVHFKGFRDVVDTIAKFLKTVFVGAIHIARDAIHALVQWWDQHKQTFVDAWNEVMKGVHKAALWFQVNVVNWIKYLIFELETWWKAHSQEIATVWHVIWETIKTVVKVAWDGTLKPTITLIVAFWRNAWDIIRDTFRLVWNVIKDVITTVLHNILGTIGIVLDLITGKWGKAWQDAKKLVSQGLHDIVQLITDIASGFGSLLYDAGANIIKGLISGIKSMLGSVGSVMSDVTSFITGFLPHSPAKWGPLTGNGSPEHGGRSIAGQLAKGILGGRRDVTAAMTQLTGSASGALTVNGSVGALAMNAPSLAAALAQAQAGSNQPIIVNVDGRKLFEILQTQALRNGRRNPTTGLVYSTT